MSHPSELSLAMQADDALMAHEAIEIEQHLADCERCRARVASLREERHILAAALAFDPVAMAVPAFARPITAGMLSIGIAAALFVAAVLSGLRGLLGSFLPEVLTWFNPLDAGRITDLAVRTGILVIQRGDAFMTSIEETAVAAVILMLLVWLVAMVRGRGRGPYWVVAGVCVLSLHPTPSHALEIRHVEKGAVFVAADETIDDSLVAAGETVEVNGNVNGDLFAFGQRVVIRGNVAGLVVTGGQSVTIDGAVDGSLFVGGETVAISSNHIGRNLLAGGQAVTVNDHVQVEQNVLVGGEKVSLAGGNGRDVFAGARELEVASTIGRNLTARAERVSILAPAHIKGDVSAVVAAKDQLVIAPDAVIGGKLDTKFGEFALRQNPFLTGSFYVSRLLSFAAAFVTGLAVLALVPGLRRVSFLDAGDAMRTGSIGLVALVATPIIAVLVCFTLIGIPLALFALVLWGAAIYLSKIVMAQLIGTHLIEAVAERRTHFAAALALGLLIITVLTSLPFVGGLVGFLVTILGIGLIFLFVRDELEPEPEPVEGGAPSS